MSIEQKIAEILAESKAMASDVETEETLAEETVAEEVTEEAQDVDTEETAVEAEEEYTVDVQEDVAALVNGEELSEEFKTKAATIFEAAIVTRVKAEVAKLEEEFEARLEEETAKNIEGIVEKVDGYLDYVVEQWIKNNEIALEAGIKSDILESFVGGLKGLFEEHNIDVPEEKFDLVAALEEETAELKSKLDEQVAANVELNQVINEATRSAILDDAAEGLAETDKEKFEALAEELSFEDAETFQAKVQTIRENYFTQMASTTIETVVTDEPIVEQVEQKQVKLDPRMASYVSALKQTN
jgi:hypothetical protein